MQTGCARQGETVEGFEHAACEHLERGRFGCAAREPEARQIERDDPMGAGQARILKRPVLEAAADAVQQQHGRARWVAFDTDAGASAVDRDDDGGAHRAATSNGIAVEFTTDCVNLRTGSSTGALRSTDRSSAYFVCATHGASEPWRGSR